MNKPYCLLGRNGDIVNLLPLLYADFQKTGQKQKLVVANQYADLLEGCSYVDPIVFKGSFTDIEGAMKMVEGMPVQVIGDQKYLNAQVYGQDLKVNTATDSFQKESWRLANRLSDWRLQLPLVFDNRSSEREEDLLKKHTSSLRKPRWIVVADHGVSSPFPYRDLLRHLIELRFNRTCDIIYLSEIKAERFYDLLGILEHPKVRCIVATDSAPLHLSYATDKPVFALIADSPSLWHGSAFRPNHVRHLRYSQFPKYAVDFVDAIASVNEAGSWKQELSPRLIHCFSQFKASGDTKKRNDFARSTWDIVYGYGRWWTAPVYESHVSRDSGTLLEDPRPVPFVSDILKVAAIRAREEDIICFSNTDTCFSPNISEHILKACAENGGCHAHRRDFNSLTRPLEASEIKKGTHYPGSDFFAFTKPFLRKVLNEFGDFLVGFESWDRVLREIVKKHGGVELKDQIYHEAHASVWEQPAVRKNHPCNKHNRRLAKKWLTENNLPLEELARFKD